VQAADDNNGDCDCFGLPEVGRICEVIMVDVFSSLREAKKFIRTLPRGTMYKIINVLDKQVFVFYYVEGMMAVDKTEK